jgi:ribosomal protein L40E
MEEYQKWKAERLAQQARNAAEKQPQSGPSAFCVKCGKQLPADSQYCSHCGVNQIRPAQIRPAKQPASFKRVMLYTVLAFVGLTILVAIYSNIDRIAPTPPDQTATENAGGNVDRELASAMARATIAHQVEEGLLKMGMDATVTINDAVENKGRIYLVISALTADRPFAHQFVSTPDMATSLKKAGFTDIEFSQCCGLEDEYIGHYDLQTGQFY